MGNTIQQVLVALTTYPGNLIYHMALAFSVAGALQAAHSLWRDHEFPQGLRMVVGLGILLGLRFTLFLSAGLVQQGLANSHVLLPIFDRAVTSLSLIVILWLWNFPEPSRTADAASGLLGLFTIILSALSWALWNGRYSELSFNAFWLDLGWEIFAIILITLGIILLLVRRPNGWQYGLGMLLVSLLGHTLHLLFPLTDSDYPGFVRLAQMSVYPILFTLPRRFAQPSPEISDSPQPGQSPKPVPRRVDSEPLVIQERQRYGIAPERLQTFLGMISETSVQKLCISIARTIAETMLADICLLVYPPGSGGQFVFQCGYDLIREETLASMGVDEEQLPLISSAMSKSRPLRLPSSSTSRDLATIGKILGLGTTGHLMAGFVESPDGKPYLGILLLSPHSDRRWSRLDQNYMEKITQGLAPFLHRAEINKAIQNDLEQTRSNLESSQTLLEQAQAENKELKERLIISQHGNLPEDEIPPVEVDLSDVMLTGTTMEWLNLQEEHKKSLDTVTRLQVENRRLGEMVESLIGEGDGHELTTSTHYQSELNEALQEITQLKNRLQNVEQDALESAGSPEEVSGMSNEQVEVFASIAQDLRQPMSSILGYSDLLLGESVGILGALQRKFLERIRASTERLEMLHDDLLRITTLDGERFEINPEAVDLGNAIDKALADTSSQMRDKKIIFRLDLPKTMPFIHADRDALQQILIHLIKNAGLVSPVEGEILLRAETQESDSDQDFVLIQVADQGGGIPKDDLPRVFSRLYRADNPLIEGVGDTGVGLSIVKTLVESHDGRIWVDTEEGSGSAFNVLLPLFDGVPISSFDEA
jgi:signal transduction histidine kinase